VRFISGRNAEVPDQAIAFSLVGHGDSIAEWAETDRYSFISLIEGLLFIESRCYLLGANHVLNESRELSQVNQAT
jgi:hypothetical protein